MVGSTAVLGHCHGGDYYYADIHPIPFNRPVTTYQYNREGMSLIMLLHLSSTNQIELVNSSGGTVISFLLTTRFGISFKQNLESVNTVY